MTYFSGHMHFKRIELELARYAKFNFMDKNVVWGTKKRSDQKCSDKFAKTRPVPPKIYKYFKAQQKNNFQNFKITPDKLSICIPENCRWVPRI